MTKGPEKPSPFLVVIIPVGVVAVAVVVVAVEMVVVVVEMGVVEMGVEVVVKLVVVDGIGVEEPQILKCFSTVPLGPQISQ